jgi:hypothetical protein
VTCVTGLFVKSLPPPLGAGVGFGLGFPGVLGVFGAGFEGGADVGWGSGTGTTTTGIGATTVGFWPDVGAVGISSRIVVHAPMPSKRTTAEPYFMARPSKKVEASYAKPRPTQVNSLHGPVRWAARAFWGQGLRETAGFW